MEMRSCEGEVGQEVPVGAAKEEGTRSSVGPLVDEVVACALATAFAATLAIALATAYAAARTAVPSNDQQLTPIHSRIAIPKA